jgi:hypothetical protein
MQPQKKRMPSHRLRNATLCCGLLGLLALSGCTLCCSPYDDDYGGFVSKTPRTDMKSGRVGSIFSDPGLAESVVTETAEPETIDVDGVEIPDPAHLDD